jgi:hypothetical protein
MLEFLGMFVGKDFQACQQLHKLQILHLIKKF